MSTLITSRRLLTPSMSKHSPSLCIPTDRAKSIKCPGMEFRRLKPLSRGSIRYELAPPNPHACPKATTRDGVQTAQPAEVWTRTVGTATLVCHPHNCPRVPQKSHQGTKTGYARLFQG